MTMEHTFALPLWSLVDKSKVEPGASDMRALARQLGRWLENNFSIQHKGTVIEEPGATNPDAEPLLVVAGVAQAHWPAMLALAQAQKTELYVVVPDADGRFSLHPLRIPPVG